MRAVESKSNEGQLQNNIQTVSGRNLIVELQSVSSFLQRFAVGNTRWYNDELQFELVWEKIEDKWNFEVHEEFQCSSNHGQRSEAV